MPTIKLSIFIIWSNVFVFKDIHGINRKLNVLKKYNKKVINNTKNNKTEYCKHHKTFIGKKWF